MEKKQEVENDDDHSFFSILRNGANMKENVGGKGRGYTKPEKAEEQMSYFLVEIYLATCFIALVHGPPPRSAFKPPPQKKINK